MELFHLALLFTTTNLGFGAVVAAFLLGRNNALQLPEWPLALAGFGLGPYLTTVLLYFTLVLWHGVTTVVLVILPWAAMAAMGAMAHGGWAQLWGMLKALPQRLWCDRSLWPFFIGSAFLGMVAMLFLLNKPLVDHDVVEYAVQGRIFLHERAIVYNRYLFDAGTGFHYVGLHGHSFPLLFTWEGLNTFWTGVQSDMWVRSITMWYAWLLIAFCWALLRRSGRWVAVAGGITLTAPIGFLFLMTIYHLDSYRIFFFTTAMAAFVALVQRPALDRLLLFAVLAGAQAFIHSVGAILACLMLAVLFFALPFPVGKRLVWLARGAAVMLAMGAVHYVIDVFAGTGWIFQDIIWY